MRTTEPWHGGVGDRGLGWQRVGTNEDECMFIMKMNDDECIHIWGRMRMNVYRDEWKQMFVVTSNDDEGIFLDGWMEKVKNRKVRDWIIESTTQSWNVPSAV